MSVLEDLLRVTLPKGPLLGRIEVSPSQYAQLKRDAEEYRERSVLLYPGVEAQVLGIPVVMVDEDLPEPRLVYVSRDGSDA